MVGCVSQWVTFSGVLAASLSISWPAFAELPGSNPPVLNHTSILLLPSYRDLVQFANNRDDEGRNSTYWLYQTQQPTEVVVERDGNRLLLVQRTERGDRQLRLQGQVKAAFEVIGLPSRVFPGLTGVRAIPPETVPNLGIGD